MFYLADAISILVSIQAPLTDDTGNELACALLQFTLKSGHLEYAFHTIQ